MSETNNIMFVVRHGERLDETPDHDWYEYCNSRYNSSKILHYSRTNDPPLTSCGKEQGKEVANRLLVEFGESKPSCIYSSKLLRAAQTAYEIAKVLSVPIVLSEGFARTAAAVEDMRDRFLFLSIEELVEYCPGVELIDGDINYQNDDNVPHTHRIPNTSSHWYGPLKHVGQQERSIVVAHRETIRNISSIRQKIPYCGYGVFQFPKIYDEDEDLMGKRRKAELLSLRHPNGSAIYV